MLIKVSIIALVAILCAFLLTFTLISYYYFKGVPLETMNCLTRAAMDAAISLKNLKKQNIFIHIKSHDFLHDNTNTNKPLHLFFSCKFKKVILFLVNITGNDLNENYLLSESQVLIGRPLRHPNIKLLDYKEILNDSSYACFYSR